MCGHVGTAVVVFLVLSTFSGVAGWGWFEAIPHRFAWLAIGILLSVVLMCGCWGRMRRRARQMLMFLDHRANEIDDLMSIRMSLIVALRRIESRR